MAGESPDRSKQRESSAESTPGSAGPVPEARDPRLAVARDAEPPAAGGGVDTATRVISARDVAKARAAALAGAEGSGPGEAEASGPGGEGASGSGALRDDAKASGRDEAEASGRDDDEAPGPDEGQAKAAGSGGGAAKGTGNADDAERPEDAGRPEDGGAATGAEGAGDEAAADAQVSGGEAAAAGAGRAGDAVTAAGAGASGTGGGAESSEGGSAKGAGTAAEAEGRSTAVAATAAGAGASGAGGGAESSEGGSVEDAGTAAEPEDGSMAAAGIADVESAGAESSEGGSAKGSGTAADAKGAGTGEAEGGKTGTAGDARLRAAVAAWVRSGDSSGTAGSGDEETAAQADGRTESGEPSESPVKADAEPVGDAEAAEPEAEASDAEDGTDPEGAGGPAVPAPTGGEGGAAVRDAVGEPRTADESDEASAKPDAPTAKTGDTADKPTPASEVAGAEGVRQGRPAVDDDSRKPPTGPQAADGEDASQGPPAVDDSREPATGPQAADGEDAPQGPPAVDDESRTGGAGGNTKGEGGAEPRVDQPTTMLKLPKAAERTSKFVALKPDVTTPVPQLGPERTTQQPLPPKPPLDLLAELTNTPPPPETALRTTVRRVKIWTPLVLLLAIVFAIVQAVRPVPTPTLQLTAEDSYSFDGSKVDIPWPADGQAALDVQGIGTFGSSGEQKSVPIASVAKVMTAYVILRDHPLKSGAEGPNIKIDQTAQDQSEAGQESTVNVTAGDSISQREALESILIASANNVARLLARWDAGSEKAFVEKMNAAAEDLGMTNTTYTDPSGLNNTTVSTAVDQVKLAKKAMEYPAFREVAAMMSYDDYKGVNHSNWNQLVGKNDVVGIKTGTTTSALGNLVFAAKKEVGGETRTIVGAVIRQPAGGVDNTILSAALTAGDQLMRAAQGALESATIIKKGDVVGYVDDGLGGHTPVVATKDVSAVGWSGLTVKLTFAADDVPHTAKAGTKVGTLTVGDDSAGAVKVPVALQKDLVEPGFTDKLTRLG